MNDLISREAALALADNLKDDLPDDGPIADTVIAHNEGILEYQTKLSLLPSVQPEWNTHTVACLLAELFDDTCACNYNDIDEWLPLKCELRHSCPHPSGVACWEQYLTHRAERK